MTSQTRPSLGDARVAIAIVIIQIFDVIIHAATDQLEPIRVTANVIIVLWLALVASGRFTAQALGSALIALGAYLVLNIIFLVQEGLTTAEGGLRVMLFGLIFVTVALSGFFIIREQNIG